MSPRSRGTYLADLAGDPSMFGVFGVGVGVLGFGVRRLTIIRKAGFTHSRTFIFFAKKTINL